MKGHGRQMAHNLNQIAHDHLERYWWAQRWLQGHFLRTHHKGTPRILDAACGCGYGSKLLASVGFEVVGVDIAPEAINFAKEHYSHDGLTYHVGDLSMMTPNALGEFDAVVSFETIEHIQKIQQVIHLFKAVAPLALVSSPNEEVYSFRKTKPLGHVRHYTPDEFNQLLNPTQILFQGAQSDKNNSEVREGEDGRFMVWAIQW